MPNGDDHREPTLGEMAIRAEDLIDRLEKENRSLRDQLNASQNQINAFKEVFKLIREEREEEGEPK